ncbi:hypothetical protein LBMAG56_14380 [Verrucomicrobiota bacterium]|nr:hypothetical protein LBMAG56_14380 [Verrucomicrobiota bacterium]
MKLIPSLLTGIVGLLAAAMTVAAAETKSLVPAFGTAGKEYTIKAKDDHKISGWLPDLWVDNSEWAAVTITYTKLTDAPAEGVGAVRIQVVKADEGQMQLTSWAGKLKCKAGGKYVVEGWVRSKDAAGLKVGLRQQGDPYEFYAEQDLDTTPEWKRFMFNFSFSDEKEGVVMFTKPEVGTVDLAGVVVTEKAAAEKK